MKSKTGELLYLLLWTCDILWRPTWRNLTDSFEGWAYRNGLLRQLQRLERQALLEEQTAQNGDRLLRLTEAGRLSALGGRDPVAAWGRRWDGLWRLVIFDVPESRNTARDKLRRHLRARGFGCLQNSVWITPGPVQQERNLLAEGQVDVQSLILLEGRPCAGETSEQIVAGAWDFLQINRRYQACQNVLARRPRGRLADPSSAALYWRWLQEEREAWLAAMERDPLLPEVLLPKGYLGREVWRQRLEMMMEGGEQMRTFRAGPG
jgi:phenylacetic acid degradation operon negative regulatory protein